IPSSCAQTSRQRVPDAGQALRAQARYACEPLVVRCPLQLFERFDSERIVNALRERVADARDRGEERERIALAVQPLERSQSSCLGKLAQRARQRGANRGETVQPLQSFFAKQITHRALQTPNARRAAAPRLDAVLIRTLVFEEIRDIIQPASDLVIRQLR